MSEPQFTASEIVKRIELALKSLPTSIPDINIQPNYKKSSKDFYEACITIKVRTLLKPEQTEEQKEI